MHAQKPAGIDELQQLFQNPPDDARIMMRWWWFGPAITHAEISRELRAMKDAGIGGVELQSVYPLTLDDARAGIKNLPFLSDEHLDALRFANDEARALGLRVDLTLGSGWPFGGPSVPIEQAAGRLRIEKVKLRGDENQVRVPTVETGEKLLAAFLAPTNGDNIAPDATHELLVASDGTVTLPPDHAGASDALFFISSRTKQQVKRAAVGAEGYVVDHYDRAAVDAYLHHVGDRLLQAFGGHPPTAVFCDSLELYGSDWTPDFLGAFQRRRGYDLKPFLPALAGNFGPGTAEIRRDYGATLTELLEENFVTPLRDWAAQHHTCFRFQGYGIPPARLSTSRLADLPEGEGAGWRGLGAARWAASTSHLYGRPVTSSETWTWVHSPAFRATPLDLKAEADLHFLQGVNQLVGHGWPSSAPGVEYPGWRFYAAGALNDQNPWWLVMPDLSRYLQRTSALLRQGQPVNDVAVYLPTDDAWAQFRGKQQADLFEALRGRIGKDVVATILDAGYDLDFFDDEALASVGKVEPGALALGPNKYQAVILPNVDRLPLESLRKLVDFADGGGTVIAVRRLPEHLPGFRVTDAQQKEFDGLVRRLSAHLVPDDKSALSAKLNALIPPDVTFSGDRADLGFLHRRAGDNDIYFIANTGPQPRHATAVFRLHSVQSETQPRPATTSDLNNVQSETQPQQAPATTARLNNVQSETQPRPATTARLNNVQSETQPQQAPATTARLNNVQSEIWNPLTGEIAPIAVTGATLPLDLEPYESRFIVFTHRRLATTPPPAPSAKGLPAPLDLSAGWQVSFDDGKSIHLDQLHSWTDDPTVRNYSGHATYEKQLDLPQNYLQPGARVLLDFGSPKPLPVETLRNGTRAWLDSPVGEAAVVFVNGTALGSVWLPPYSVDVTRALRPGANQLKVIVGNTAINRLAGEHPPDYKPLNKKYSERFKPQDMDKLQPPPSGLLGPIRLMSTASNK